MLDGVYILHDNGFLLLSFPSRTRSIVTQAQLSSCVESARENLGERLPPSWSKLHEITESQLLYQRKYGHIHLFIPCDTTTPLLVVEEVSNRVITVIETYFGEQVSPSLIEAKKAQIVLLLSEMLDTGVPRITEPDILRQLVPEDSFFARLLGGATSATSSSSALGAAATGKSNMALNGLSEQETSTSLAPWVIPWRRAKVHHAKQELFVDVIEHVKMVVQKTGEVRTRRYEGGSHIIGALKARVHVKGEIKLLSRLSGVPQVTIFLNGGGGLQNTRLHRCVDQKLWNESNGVNMSFIPADGESVVARYESVTNEVGPVLAELIRRPGGGGFEFWITTAIDTKVKHLNTLLAIIVFPPKVKSVKELSATGADDFDTSNPQRCELRYRQSVPMGWSGMLSALATDADGEPVAPLYAEIKYSLLGRTPSGATVRTINIASSSKKASHEAAPFQGVRYQTFADNYIVK